MRTEDLTGPVMAMWTQTASALPMILGAIVILVIGLIASSVFSSAVRKLVEALKLDSFVERFSVFRKAQESGWRIRPSHIAGTFVKWFFIIVTLIAVSDRLGLDTISEFLNQIVNYIPQVVVAMVLLAVGFMVAQFVHDIAKQSFKTADAHDAAHKYAPLVAKYAIITFASMAAATQLGIAEDLIQTFFTAFVFALALALGLSFGLGGKEHASRALDRLIK